MNKKFFKNKNMVLIGLLVITVLAGAFYFGGNHPNGGSSAKNGDKNAPIATNEDPSDTSEEGVSGGDTDKENIENKKAADLEDQKTENQKEEEQNSSEKNSSNDKKSSESKKMEINPETGKDKYQTDPVPEGKPLPVEPQDKVTTGNTLSATLSVRCDTLLDNMDRLDKEKWELVPEDGVIFAAQTVSFVEGESVFDILQREMKNAKIHMEFVNTPMYNSAYIEGINNLYEFDGGELSGWMFKVNDWFPNYGSSRYMVENGDVIEWVYTCDLGRDVGNEWLGGS